MDFELRQLLADAGDDEARLTAAVDRMAEVHGKQVYQLIFSEFFDKQIDLDRAGRYWKEALVRWNSQKNSRGARQSIKTALLDYLQSVVGDHISSLTDGLTGLYSQIYLTTHLDQLLGSRKATPTPARHALVILDFDTPDQVKTSLQSFEVDQALRRVGRIIKETVRKIDTPAALNDGRIGLLIVEAGRNEAFAIAERIRKSIAEESFSGEQTLKNGKLTVSCGIATFPEDGLRAAQLMVLAGDKQKLAARTGNRTSPESSERRKDNRYAVSAMVEISGIKEKHYTPAMAYNISRHGMAIGCGLEVSDERTVSVRFRHPYWPVSKESRAIIKQSAPQGASGLLRFGLEFMEPESELYQPFSN
jgi:diguanylate cyclase (GGDEF)-like protein